MPQPKEGASMATRNVPQSQPLIPDVRGLTAELADPLIARVDALRRERDIYRDLAVQAIHQLHDTLPRCSQCRRPQRVPATCQRIAGAA